MICYECVLKHLSAALSYGKEIISGHGKGADLDHRPDYLGQIVNCEHHLQLIDKKLFDEISTYRKQLQSKKIQIDQNDLAFIRRIYNLVELKEDGIDSAPKVERIMFEENPDVIYLEVKNRKQFQFSYELLKKNLVNYNKVYVLNPEVDLTGIDVQVINETMKDFIKRENLTQNLVIMYGNTSFLKEIDARSIPTSFTMNIKNHRQIFKQAKQIGITGKMQIFDYIKAQIVNKNEFSSIVSEYTGKYPLTAYNMLLDKNNAAPDNLLTVDVERAVCCSTKNELKTKRFVRWNDEAFQSLVDFLNK